MQFLKILFWCLIAFVAAVFTVGNWTTVPIHLWGGLIADVNLPVLLLVVFLIGLLPSLLYHQAVKWRLRQRLNTAEQALGELRAPLAAPAPVVAIEPAAESAAVPPTRSGDGV